MVSHMVLQDASTMNCSGSLPLPDVILKLSFPNQ